MPVKATDRLRRCYSLESPTVGCESRSSGGWPFRLSAALPFIVSRRRYSPRKRPFGGLMTIKTPSTSSSRIASRIAFLWTDSGNTDFRAGWSNVPDWCSTNSRSKLTAGFFKADALAKRCLSSRALFSPSEDSGTPGSAYLINCCRNRLSRLYSPRCRAISASIVCRLMVTKPSIGGCIVSTVQRALSAIFPKPE